MLSSTSDDADRRAQARAASPASRSSYTYPRLFNLYLDPKETHSYLTRKLAYLEVLREGMRAHLATFQSVSAEARHGPPRSAAGAAKPPG